MNKNSNGKRLLDIEDPSCPLGGGGKAPPYLPPLKVDDKNSLKAPALLKPKPNHNCNNSCQSGKERPLLSPSPSGVDHSESTLSSSAEEIADCQKEIKKCRWKIKELTEILNNAMDALVARDSELGLDDESLPSVEGRT